MSSRVFWAALAVVGMLGTAPQSEAIGKSKDPTLSDLQKNPTSLNGVSTGNGGTTTPGGVGFDEPGFPGTSPATGTSGGGLSGNFVVGLKSPTPVPPCANPQTTIRLKCKNQATKIQLGQASTPPGVGGFAQGSVPITGGNVQSMITAWGGSTPLSDISMEAVFTWDFSGEALLWETGIKALFKK